MINQIFEKGNGLVRQQLTIGSRVSITEMQDLSDSDLPSNDSWWQSKLREKLKPVISQKQPLTIVDAFSGSGGLSLGASMAIEAAGFLPRHIAAIDTDEVALKIHKYNFNTQKILDDSVSRLVDFHVTGQGQGAEFSYTPELLTTDLILDSNIDVFLAGPPCQGHSNLNNHTRRADPRNQLYVTSVALGLALKAKCIIIENVPMVVNDKSNVVGTAESLLKRAGYSVTCKILRAHDLGAAQSRARFFLIATLTGNADAVANATISLLSSTAMPLSWAIGDLLDYPSIGLFDTPATPSPITTDRINYLFDNDLYDLPNEQRPDCHKDGHTYPSVYGRMYWDKPAQTITTGFNAAGQGRYVHPKRRRVITPHEAARIQGFPDWFSLTPEGIQVTRKHLSKWIGDAVHPILGYAAMLIGLTALDY